MNDWRLVSDLEAYVVLTRKQIWLAASGKKSYKGDVVKNIDSSYRDSYQEIHIEDNAFELKLDVGLNVWIRSDQLPEPEEWYQVMNYLTPEKKLEGLGKIITQVNSNLGDFGETTFEAAFSDRDKGQVMFVAEGMSEYDDYFDEMTRRMNCSIYKKTKKWIPGHRYDSEQETFYYLCALKSRRKEEYSSGFTSLASEMPEIHLVTRKPGQWKTVKEFLENSVFGERPQDIQVLKSPASMVDSGEALSAADMPSDIRDLWPKMFESAVSVYGGQGGVTAWKTPKYIYDIFCYQTPGKEDYTVGVTEEMKDILRGILTNTMYSNLITYWGIDSIRDSLKVGSTFDGNTNAEHLVSLYFSRLEDGNALRFIYYSGLFQELGIDLEKIAKDCVGSWDVGSVMFGNFDDYVKYGDLYFKYHDQGSTEKVSQQRVKSSNQKQKQITIADACAGDNILSQTLVELVNKSMETYGVGITSFKISNVGTKRSPMEFVTAEVTLNDIVRHYQGNVPERLKQEIMSQKFRRLVVDFDKDEIVK